MEQQNGKNKNGKKKSVSKDELETTHSGNALSGTGVSIKIHEATSPTPTEDTEFSTCQNTDTSFSNLSSRSLSVDSGDSFKSTSEVDKPKVEQKSKDAMSGNINTSQTPHEGEELLKVDSALSLKSNVSDETTPKSRKVSGKSQKKKSELKHSKTESSASTGTIGPLRRTDSKTVSMAAKERPADRTNSTVDDANVDTQKEDVQALAKINLDDPEQFPALGQAKSPPSNASTLDSFITVLKFSLGHIPSILRRHLRLSCSFFPHLSQLYPLVHMLTLGCLQMADGKRPAPVMSFRPSPPVMGPLAPRIAPSGSQNNQTRPVVAVPRVIKSGPKP